MEEGSPARLSRASATAHGPITLAWEPAAPGTSSSWGHALAASCMSVRVWGSGPGAPAAVRDTPPGAWVSFGHWRLASLPAGPELVAGLGWSPAGPDGRPWPAAPQAPPPARPQLCQAPRPLSPLGPALLSRRLHAALPLPPLSAPTSPSPPGPQPALRHRLVQALPADNEAPGQRLAGERPTSTQGPDGRGVPGADAAAWGPPRADPGGGPAPGRRGEGADACLASQTSPEAWISQVGRGRAGSEDNRPPVGATRQP